MTGSKLTMHYLREYAGRKALQNTRAKEEIKKATRRLIGIGCIVLALCFAILYAVRVASIWFDKNQITTKPILQISAKVNKPIQVTPRQPVEKPNEELVKMVAENEKPELAKYICEKFGEANCAVALAVAKAESGMRCDALNINVGSADLGVFQLNTIHLAKGGGWTLSKMGDCYGNVDLAYELWKQNGWGAWVAYTNRSYLAKL